MLKSFKLFLKGILICLFVNIFQSCGEFVWPYEDDTAEKIKKQEYADAFTAEFGHIDELNVWGFDKIIPDSAEMEKYFKHMTRAANTNSNQWSDYVEVPTVLTEEQRTKVTNWFKSHKSPNSISISWSDFFVEQVYYERQNMDMLLVAKTDHVNNFNQAAGSLMLMENTSSTDFTYHNSLDSKYYSDYVVIDGYTISPELKGSYFVGFDFQANGQTEDQREELDGFYCDWIVRISPAIHKTNRRIMAEDLGAIGDFDFNDVVFDVALCDPIVISWWPYEAYYTSAIITLQAAGGTLPLYVGDFDHEVHKLFGVDTKVMVNTHGGTVQKETVMYRISGKFTSANDIRVFVNFMEITSEQGIAPGKICMPTTVKWTNERQNIKRKYPKFEDYVGDASVIWWE